MSHNLQFLKTVHCKSIILFGVNKAGYDSTAGKYPRGGVLLESHL
jgi:hypothetical protein